MLRKRRLGVGERVWYLFGYPELQQRIKEMKYLLSGVAIVAALAIAAPASAQRTGPGAGAGTSTGPTGVAPGGPGPSSPMSNLPTTRGEQYPPPPAAMPPGSPGMAPGMSSATPPAHRPARHGKMASKGGGRTQLTGSGADQLNREELARLQAGNFSMPPAPPPPDAGSTDTTRGPGRQMRRENAPSR